MEKLVIYGTTQTHSLGAKAALILGVRFRALEVDAEDNYSLRGETLSRALKEDREAGLHPYIMSYVLKCLRCSQLTLYSCYGRNNLFRGGG